MGFWIIVAVLAVLVAAWLILATLRGRAVAEPAAAYDMRVYRDQLSEVERDLARGVIAPEDADRVRAEVSRRILAADAKLSDATTSDGVVGRGTMVLAAVLMIGLLGGSLALYARLGVPGYGDLPQVTRIELAAQARAERPSQAEVESSMPPLPSLETQRDDYVALVEKLREIVKERPDDMQGLMLLARNEALLGNFKAAYQAQAQIVALQGDNATALDIVNYADLLILAVSGYVSPEAEAALVRALQVDPRNGTAQYYWGLMLGQTGRPDLAFNTWQRLLRDSDADAPWVGPIQSQIEEMAMRAGAEYRPPDVPRTAPLAGPSSEDIEAAGDLSAEDRMTMIRGMVEGLSDRLATSGGTPQEWARLIGALGVLGEDDQARAIWQNAQEVFVGNDAALAPIRDAAQQAGVLE